MPRGLRRGEDLLAAGRRSTTNSDLGDVETLRRLLSAAQLDSQLFRLSLSETIQESPQDAGMALHVNH